MRRGGKSGAISGIVRMALLLFFEVARVGWVGEGGWLCAGQLGGSVCAGGSHFYSLWIFGRGI